MGREFDRGGRGQRGGRGAPRGGRGGRGGPRGGVGARGKPQTRIEPHRHSGIFVAKGKEEFLVTRNMVPGESVYGEKRIDIELPLKEGENTKVKVDYRVWNAFRSKLAACVVNGIENIYIKPGAKVLYLGAANGTTVSHVSDVVGETGCVYAVEYSERSGRDLINMAKKRPNIVPIIDDARKPWNYRYVINSLVDCIFADVAQPDQARIIHINAEHFLKNGGGFVFSIKANCIDSTADAETVFADQIQKLRKAGFKVKEKVTLEPYERDHAVVTGIYKPIAKDK